jgi:hypothetical protein
MVSCDFRGTRRSGVRGPRFRGLGIPALASDNLLGDEVRRRPNGANEAVSILHECRNRGRVRRDVGAHGGTPYASRSIETP